MPFTRSPAIFLDRDGVILENREDYIKSVAEAVFAPRALEALARLAATRYRIVIATNQSLIGRGIIPVAAARAINHWVLSEIGRAGGRIDAVYICPHAPDAGCTCRKPKPGMLLDAAADLALDLTNSIFIGDALTDVQAAEAAGVRAVLVRTGRGWEQAQLLSANGFAHVPVYDDLMAAVEAILDGKLPHAKAQSR
ncbi:MAG: D-glycero-beta-D-manno-heptose 1,7-bisphosphate 7-phosphatase [Chloroflexi bacterium]|nr:D-glycero-beta-D-manno-heptose 1,7-bisphosphate 7-phosphatase [Chloroflexota bacterium]